MRRQIVLCDRCTAEITGDPHLADVVKPDLVRLIRAELCATCATAVVDFIKAGDVN